MGEKAFEQCQILTKAALEHIRGSESKRLNAITIAKLEHAYEWHRTARHEGYVDAGHKFCRFPRHLRFTYPGTGIGVWLTYLIRAARSTSVTSLDISTVDGM